MSQGPVPVGPLGSRTAGGPGRARGAPGPRVVVVGAGLVGAAVAESLTRRSARVTVVERGRAGAAASAHSMGLANASAGIKFEPAAYLELSVAAVTAYDQLARDLAPAGWLHRSGHLEWVPAAQAEELRGRVGLLSEYGYPAGVITAAETRALEPALRVGVGDQVAWYPAEVWVDGTRLVRRLLDAAVSRGAELREETTVAGLTRGDGRVTGVEVTPTRGAGGQTPGGQTPGGDRITADVVVNAAGPDAERLAHAAGSPLALRPAPALVAYLETGEGRVPVGRPVTTPYANLRPHGAAQLWANAVATDAALLDRDLNGDLSDLTAQLLAVVREAVRLPGNLVAGAVTVATARRPMPRDGLPSVGRPVAAPGYYEAVMHSGATLAPLVGDLIAEEVVTGEPAPVLDPFRPDRFTPDRPSPVDSRNK